VIVVDDCSNTENYRQIEKIIRGFQNKINIILVRNDRNEGANVSRNRGVDLASENLIAFLDSDDIWMPDKLKIQLKAIEANRSIKKEPVLSSTGRYRVDKDGVIFCVQFSRKKYTHSTIRESNFIGTLSSVIVSRTALVHVHGFDHELVACQDWDLFIRLCGLVNYIAVPDPLCVYVDHTDERITLNNKKRIRAHLKIYKKHIKSFGRRNLRLFEFYRNLAADYQADRNHQKATQFYARALDNRSIGFFRDKLFFVFRLWISIVGMPRIKEARYQRYRKNFSRIQNENSLKSIELSQKVIGEYFGCSDP
jgi:glycosyltransferase involved in cell wall biosynthesis